MNDNTEINMKPGDLVWFYEPYELIHELMLLISFDHDTCKVMTMSGTQYNCDISYIFPVSA